MSIKARAKTLVATKGARGKVFYNTAKATRDQSKPGAVGNPHKHNVLIILSIKYQAPSIKCQVSNTMYIGLGSKY